MPMMAAAVDPPLLVVKARVSNLVQEMYDISLRIR